MADEFRSIRENLFKVLSGKSRDDDDSDDEMGGGYILDAGAVKALLTAIFARAGKGKDDLVQTISREIGLAVAGMLKEPLAQLAKHQKLQISFEFVPKAGHEAAAEELGSSLKPRRTSPTKRSKRRRKPDIG